MMIQRILKILLKLALGVSQSGRYLIIKDQNENFCKLLPIETLQPDLSEFLTAKDVENPVKQSDFVISQDALNSFSIFAKTIQDFGIEVERINTGQFFIRIPEFENLGDIRKMVTMQISANKSQAYFYNIFSHYSEPETFIYFEVRDKTGDYTDFIGYGVNISIKYNLTK